MRSLRSLLLALSILMIGLRVLVGVTLAQAPGGQDLPPHQLPDTQFEAPAPFDPAPPNQYLRDLAFPSTQAASDTPMSTPKPVMPTQLMDLVGSELKAPQAFPWQPNQVVYDSTQLCGEQESPAIAVDAAGNAYAVWQDCRNLNNNFNWDIYFAYRPVGGTWSANQRVSDDPGSARQQDPAIAVDSAGNAYAVWADERNGNYAIYFAYRPAGGSWGANQRVNDSSAYVFPHRPGIAVDAAGNAYAIWADYRNGSVDIYFAYRPAGGSWGANQRVNDDPGAAHQEDPSIAVDGAGNAYAVWQDRRNGYYDIYFAYRPAGGSWNANQRVNDDLGENGHEYPAIAVDSAGNAYAVWEDGRNGIAYIYFSYRPAGGNWGANQRVDDEVGSAGIHSPAIAVDSAGDAYAVWGDGRNGTGDIYFSYRPAGGNWGANQRVDDDHGSLGQLSPAIAVDGAGNAYTVWQDQRNGSNFDINYDIYFAYRPADSSWIANQRVNDDPGSAQQREPVIAVDAAGNAYAVWTDYRNGNYDIYFAYRPAGGSWGANERVNDDLGSAQQRCPSIAVDGAGNAYAVWGDERNDSSAIYFAYRPAGGNWGANQQVDNDPVNAYQDSPAIAVDGAGNAYAVWGDQRNGNSAIYFAYRPASGSWGANQRVDDGSFNAYPSHPAIAADSAGNGYAVWQDYRNGNGDSNYDIYFAYRPAGDSWGTNQRVNDDLGNALQFFPAIAVDAAGNAYAVWTDQRNSSPNVYFAYRPTSGGWGVNRQVDDPLANAYPYNPAIAVDAAGNAYAVWIDYRNGNYDIYFAYRPAGSSWGANQRVDDGRSGAEQHVPTIAVDGVGNAYALWEDDRNNQTPHIYFSYTLHDDLPLRTPTPQITFPLPGATNQNSFVIQGIACPDCQVSIYDGDALLGSVIATANGLFSKPATLANGSHILTAVAQYLGSPTPWLPSLPSAPVPLSVDSSLRIDPQRLTLAYTMWGGQTVVLRPRDPSGLLVSCSGEVSIPGFFTRPNFSNTLTVAVSGSPTHVQVVVAGVGVFDLAPIGGDLWQTNFTVNAGHNLTIRISDDGGVIFANQCTGQVLIDPQGVISDAGTSQPIQGATVTCYVATEGGEWIRWPAENFDGQTNPQYTAANGFYAFFTPPGSYQIEAWAPGYIPQRTGTIIVTSQLVEVNLALQPLAAPCPADLNGDGEVSVTDIIAIAGKWNAVSPNFPYAPGFDLMPVGAPDGAITIADIQYVAGHWGETCTP